MTRHAKTVVAGVVAAVASIGSAVAVGPPLGRDPSSFVIFGLKHVGLKNFTLDGACNVGVDCAQPATNSDCGVVTHENAIYASGSQVAGDVAKFTRPGAVVWQVFTNKLVSPENVDIRGGLAGLAPLPILGDRDGDGQPSCRVDGGRCTVDPGDLYAACGFPDPFPPCDSAKTVTVLANGDCTGAVDLVPGNGRCDLGPGAYGDVTVQNAASLTLTGGDYAVCKFVAGRSTNIIATAPATLAVSGDFWLNNDTAFGQQCGDIVVNARGPGGFTFGRNSFIVGRFCAPERTLLLGHNNDLKGQFLGDTLQSDSDLRGHCCGGGGGTCVAEPPPTGTRELDRDLDRYVIVAQRKAGLKNMAVDAACDVGVNCAPPQPGGTCGVMALADVTFVDGSQTVGDSVYVRKPGAVIDQLFRNGGGPLSNVTYELPVRPFDPTPIFPGTCDPGCRVTGANLSALEALCGFPSPFPACDPSRGVRALPGADCSAFDAVPGNGACDLAPGAYGAVDVQNKATLNLNGGPYVLCGLRAGRTVRITATGATVLIPGGGAFRVNNGSTVASACGELAVLVQGRGRVSFGRNLRVAMDLCAPQSVVRLGHNNGLLGRFVGDVVNADLNNHAECCVPRCVCANPFTPATASVGQPVTIDADADCDLSTITSVKVCGIAAQITSSTATQLVVTVPAGAAGSCTIQVGEFELAEPLVVR